MKNRFFIYLEDYFATGYHVKSSAISISVRTVSAIIALGGYLFLNQLLDAQLEDVELFSLGVVVLASVLLLMPLQEKLVIKLKDLFLSGYLTDDIASLRVAKRRLDLQSLVRYVFPDMVKITGSVSGKLGILDNRQSGFMIYSYSRGRQRKIRTKETLQTDSPLIQLLLEKKRSVSIGETVNDHEINNGFIALRANYIIPFFFREKLFGFLASTNLPPHNEIANLNILASKAALTIYNYILSSTVVEHIKYRKEFEFADKIQDLMLDTRMPEMDLFEVLMSNRDPSLIVEFFHIGDKWHFVVVGISLGHRGSGLVLSYLLGVIYSRYNTQKIPGISSVFNLVKSTLEEISYRDDYCLVAGVVNQEERSIDLIYNGKGMRLFVGKDNIEPKEGKKTTVILEKQSLLIRIKDCTMIEFRSKP